MTIKVSRQSFKAARVLLELDQKDVEAVTGISCQRISQYERGTIGIGKKAYQTFLSFYDARGIEFLDHDGIRRKPERDYLRLNGRVGFRVFMDDVYQTARDEGGRIEIINGPPDLFIKWLGEQWYHNHANRMEAIKDKITMRILTGEDQTNLIARGFALYKTVPKDKFNTQTIYIFGKKVGLFTFTEKDVVIDVFRQKDLVDTFHWLFDLVWGESN